MNQLHALVGPILLLGTLGLAVAAAVAASRNALPPALDVVRRALLGLVVAEAAIGLALAVRGNAPAEGIHWLYGVAIVAALLVPGMLRPELPSARRSAAVAVGAGFAAIMAWRLGASG